MSEERTFEHFPDTATCPLCGTSDDKECCLIPIDGTDDGDCCEAQPMHVECVRKLSQYRYNKVIGAVYARHNVSGSLDRKGGEDGKTRD